MEYFENRKYKIFSNAKWLFRFIEYTITNTIVGSTHVLRLSDRREWITCAKIVNYFDRVNLPPTIHPYPTFQIWRYSIYIFPKLPLPTTEKKKPKFSISNPRPHPYSYYIKIPHLKPKEKKKEGEEKCIKRNC